jgi:hypothetical protein
LANRIDWIPTHINSLTASTPACIRTPIHFPTDYECLSRIIPTVGKFDSKEVTIGWVRNSLELSLIGLTENLLPEIRNNPMLEILGPAEEFPFDRAGDLTGAFAEAEELKHMPSPAGG